tara:strand:- start:3662 stop:4483 length:822 start_codon:yes stop_codon:yes gene_type:complete
MSPVETLSRDLFRKLRDVYDPKDPNALPTLLQVNMWDSERALFTIVYEVPSSTKKVCWLFIPKNGTHYVMKRFKLTYDKHLREVYHPSALDPHTGAPRSVPNMIDDLQDPSHLTFIVVRDPIERTISSYQEMLKLRADTPLTAAITKQMKFYATRDNPTKSFFLFLKEIEKYGFYDQHLYPQIKFIEDRNLSLEQVNAVILFDHIEQGLTTLAQMWDIEALSHEDLGEAFINEGDKKIKTELMEFIDKNEPARELITKLYKDDIDLYDEFKNR